MGKEFNKVDPRECINGKVRRLQKMIYNYYQKELKPFNVKGSMLSILFIIGKRKDVNQKSIYNQLILDPSTMSRDIKKLKERGFIEIRKGEDSRNTIINITRKGEEFLEEVSPVWRQLHHNVAEVLGPSNIKALDRILNKAYAHLK